MATSLESSFDSWLSLKLKSLNTDEGVFGSYISGILTGDESVEEKTEALEGIIREITENDIAIHCREILEKWDESQNELAELATKSEVDVEDKLVRLLETSALSTTVQREYTEEERKIREAILSQYGEVQLSDQECEDVGAEEAAEKNMVKNTNVTSVIQADKEKREKAKVDSQKKKEKDKEDRERQKQQQADKKEKRKTQKGERRR